QIDREKAIDLFNNGTTPILVSTDLGSRGWDIDDVNYIIHYHMPPSPESWTHRNGRTARMGASGSVFVITAPDEKMPEYIGITNSYVPAEHPANPIRSDVATLYFNLGRREKISRGDVAGYLIQKGGLEAPEIGKIIVRDHCALAAVPAAKADEVIAAVKSDKIKGQRVRVSLMQ
ncbi:MAG: DbpA RNA binding domain-containing protein, partial [Muribaculaceae bacterium]|nr:DbpA RNA binding domain-containing protein [Muribaculaceae bacterium]